MAIDEFLGSTMNYGYEKIALGMTWIFAGEVLGYSVNEVTAKIPSGYD